MLNASTWTMAGPYLGQDIKIGLALHQIVILDVAKPLEARGTHSWAAPPNADFEPLSFAEQVLDRACAVVAHVGARCGGRDLWVSRCDSLSQYIVLDADLLEIGYLSK